MNKRFTKKKKQKSNFIYSSIITKRTFLTIILQNLSDFLTNLNFFPTLKLSQKRKKIPSKRELQNPRTFINPNRVSLPSPFVFEGEPFRTNEKPAIKQKKEEIKKPSIKEKEGKKGNNIVERSRRKIHGAYKWRWVGVDRKPIRHYAEHVVPNQSDHGVSTRAEIVPGKSIYMAIKPPWIYYVERSNPTSPSIIIIERPLTLFMCVNAKWRPSLESNLTRRKQ